MNLKSKMEVGIEFVRFLKSNKKYFLIPFFIVFVLFAVLIVAAQTGGVVSPFIYVLF